MRLVFYHSNGLSKENVWCDLDRILKDLEELKARGVSCELIDTVNMSEEQLYDAYTKAIMASVFKRFPVRRVFGTRNRSGVFFGRQVPALLIYEEGSPFPVDLYPKIDRGKRISIEDFLENLLKSGN